MAGTRHDEEESREEINMRAAVIYGQRDVHFKERALPITAMTHIAIQQHLDSKGVDWMEKVSDDQYRR
jgi:hypothetical protein